MVVVCAVLAQAFGVPPFLGRAESTDTDILGLVIEP
jgi:hypothetical protein